MKMDLPTLYFAALANVSSGTPFFPAAYHDDGSPAFAIATEAADLAVAAFTQANNLAEARSNLITALENNAKKLTAVADSLTGQFADSLNLQFGGIDYSLAPFPEVELSLGTAMERLGVPAVGYHGSLAAAAFMTDTVDQAKFARTGFSGLMLPVLEDATLAARAEAGYFDDQGYAAVFRSLRNRPGYGSLARRYDGRAIASRAAGPGCAGTTARQTTDRAADANPWQGWPAIPPGLILPSLPTAGCWLWKQSL